MWLKVLKVVVQVAVATGLDKKAKAWLLGKIRKAEAKAVEKFDAAMDKVDELEEKLAEEPEV